MTESSPISGEIARVKFELEIFYDPNDPVPATSAAVSTEPVYNDLAVARIIRSKALDELGAIASDNFRTALGDDALQVDLSVKVGSVEIVAIVTTVALVIQNYNAIVGGIGEAVENTRRAFVNVVGGLRELGAWRGQMEMRASWRTGAALAPSSQSPRSLTNLPSQAPDRGTLTRDNILLLVLVAQTGLLISLLILALLQA
jgi:hypothetical protein